MSDDLTKKRPHDSNKINPSQQWEIDYWTEVLHTTEERLLTVVYKVGPYILDLKRKFTVSLITKCYLRILR